MTACRFSSSRTKRRSCSATSASILAVSRSRKAAMACCSLRGGPQRHHTSHELPARPRHFRAIGRAVDYGDDAGGEKKALKIVRADSGHVSENVKVSYSLPRPCRYPPLREVWSQLTEQDIAWLEPDLLTRVVALRTQVAPSPAFDVFKSNRKPPRFGSVRDNPGQPFDRQGLPMARDRPKPGDASLLVSWKATHAANPSNIARIRSVLAFNSASISARSRGGSNT